jgi:hypothetical protein
MWDGGSHWRWTALFVVVATLELFAASLASAETVTPAELQADLLAKLVAYDRNFIGRAGGMAEVILLAKRDDPGSKKGAMAMSFALSRIDRLGDLPHRETIVEFDSATSVARLCSKRRAAVLYVSSGLDGEIGGLRAALSDVSVLSVSAVPEYVPAGIVLGFDLVSGKPKLLLNLPQAKKQNIDFVAPVLALMKIFR